MRQTDLTALQIIHRLEDDDQEYPTCFYINELGELAQAGDTTAEAVLHHYLDSHVSSAERAPAYLHLKLCSHSVSKQTRLQLEAFETNLANRDILVWAQPKLAELTTH